MKVRVVTRKDGWCLVAWTDAAGMPQRSWVVEDHTVADSWGEVEVEDPAAGIPYGFDFSQIPIRNISSVELCAELRRRGLWTIEDVKTNAQAAVAALLTVAGITWAGFLDKVNSVDSGGTE
jgi:hypothetical protein